MRLIDAPVGLFLFDGVMCLKTEYSTDGRVDAFVVESGEFFCGGATTTEELNNLEVVPIEAVPIVRCKECIYWKSGENECDKWEHCILHNICIGPYSFCSYGERKRC